MLCYKTLLELFNTQLDKAIEAVLVLHLLCDDIQGGLDLFVAIETILRRRRRIRDCKVKQLDTRTILGRVRTDWHTVLDYERARTGLSKRALKQLAGALLFAQEPDCEYRAESITFVNGTHVCASIEPRSIQRLLETGQAGIEIIIRCVLEREIEQTFNLDCPQSLSERLRKEKWHTIFDGVSPNILDPGYGQVLYIGEHPNYCEQDDEEESADE